MNTYEIVLQRFINKLQSFVLHFNSEENPISSVDRWKMEYSTVNPCIKVVYRLFSDPCGNRSTGSVEHGTAKYKVLNHVLHYYYTFFFILYTESFHKVKKKADHRPIIRKCELFDKEYFCLAFADRSNGYR